MRRENDHDVDYARNAFLFLGKVSEISATQHLSPTWITLKYPGPTVNSIFVFQSSVIELRYVFSSLSCTIHYVEVIPYSVALLLCVIG